MFSLDKGVFNEQVPTSAGKKICLEKTFLCTTRRTESALCLFLGSGCEPTETETDLSSVNILHLELYMSFSNDIENIPLNNQLFHCFCCDLEF